MFSGKILRKGSFTFYLKAAIMPFPHWRLPHLPPSQPPRNPFLAFYTITGVTFFAFVTGFSACLFDMSQISACVDYAEKALAILQKFGDHVLQWFIAIVKEVFARNGIGR